MDFSNLHENRPGLILIGKRDTLIDGHRYIELTGAAFVSALNLHCAEFLRCWIFIRFLRQRNRPCKMFRNRELLDRGEGG